MATVSTWDVAWSVMALTAQAYRETRELAGINALNLDGIEESIRDAIRGNNRDRVIGSITARRAEINAAVTNKKGWIANTIWEIRDVIGSTAVTATDMVSDIRDKMTAHNTSGASVASRNITRGAVVEGGTNRATNATQAGFQFIYYDKYGFEIEDGRFGPKVVAKVTGDGNSGLASGAEQWRLYTSGILAPDAMISGTAIPDGPVHRTRAAEDATNILGNPKLRITQSGNTHQYSPWFTSNAVYTGINAWSTSAARIVRGTAGQNALCGTWAALAISTAVNRLLQKIKGTVDRERPYPRYIWYRGVDAWDGVLHYKLGTHEVATTSASLNTWAVLETVGTTSAAKNLFYENFKAIPLLAEIWVTGRTAGAVLISDVYAGAADYYNGRFFIFRPGRIDAFEDDQWDWTDAETNSHGNQGIFNAAYPEQNALPGLYFHHTKAVTSGTNGGIATIPDPA